MVITKKFKRRNSSNIKPNSKTNTSTRKPDTPPNTSSTLPTWAKYVIAINLIMVHAVVLMTGFNYFPFMLSDTALVVYIVSGIGTPVGLASKTVQNALASMFGTKQN